MRETDLGAVDEAIARGFDYGEDVVVGWVEEEGVETGVYVVH